MAVADRVRRESGATMTSKGVEARMNVSIKRACAPVGALGLALVFSACASKPADPADGANRSNGIADAEVRNVGDLGSIKLRDGLYEGPPYAAGGASRPRVLLLGHTERRGDLDGAPGDEIAVLLAASTGGSGEYIYLAVFGAANRSARNIATTPIGDRVKMRDMAITNRTIVLDVLEAGPADAMCCPTQLGRRTYQLDKGVLKQVSNDVNGALALAAIAGTEWRLIEIDGKPLPEGAKAPTFNVEAGRVSGFAGCNQYTGGIEETSPGSISLGQQAVTMKACTEPYASVERDFLRRLSKVQSYTFLGGRLALSWLDDDQRGILLFEK